MPNLKDLKSEYLRQAGVSLCDVIDNLELIDHKLALKAMALLDEINNARNAAINK